MSKFDIGYVQSQILDLLAVYPELEEDEILRADSIQGQTTAFEFLSQIVRKIGSTEALNNGLAGYIEELKQRRERLDRREHALRSLIFKVMQTAELHKVQLPEATLSIRTGQRKVCIIEEKLIPQDFLRIKTEPDKTKIKAALAAGEHVPGTALSNAEPVLAIIK